MDRAQADCGKASIMAQNQADHSAGPIDRSDAGRESGGEQPRETFP